MLAKLNLLNNELDNFFNGSLFTNSYLPLIDLIEEENKFVIEVEVPGFNEEDIEINIDGNKLTVRGERKTSSESSEKKYHRIERRHGSFTRSFSLPTHVSEEDILAKFKNGILTIEVPKMPKSIPKKIKILTD